MFSAQHRIVPKSNSCNTSDDEVFVRNSVELIEYIFRQQQEIHHKIAYLFTLTGVYERVDAADEWIL